MTNKQKSIGAGQLAILFFCFMTGSSIVNVVSPLIGNAKNGAWLSLLISGSAGMLLLWGSLYLNRRFPGLTFIEYSQVLVGKWATIVLSLLTVTFVFVILTAMVVEIGLFLNSSMMRETPMIVFNSMVFILAAITAQAGLEVMARMFTLLILVILAFIVFVLIFAAPNYEWTHLFPVLPYGIKPVLHGAFLTYDFPFSDLFLFTMLLPFVGKDSLKKVPRLMYLSLFLNIIMLILVTLCTIMLFGPLAAKRKYSLFEIARTIDVLDIVQRIESVIGMSLVAGSYMKASITLFVLNMMCCQLFKVKDSRLLIYPLALIGVLHTLVLFRNSMDWVHFLSVTTPVWSIFAFTIPLVTMVIVALLRRGQSMS